MSAPTPQVMSWPLGGLTDDGRMAYTTEDDSVREVIRNILLTRPGERLRRNNFGAGITRFIHQSNTVTTRTMIANVVRKAIEQWETRVIVENVEVIPDQLELATVHINIRYQMRYSRRLNQLTLSLDLNAV